MNLSYDLIDYLVDERGFRFSDDKDGQAAKKLSTIYAQGRSPKKLIVLDCNLSITRTKSILAMLGASINEQDFLYKDLADIINDSFNNQKIQLKKVNVITTLYSVSKQLKSKFIQDLQLQANLENKILVLLVDNFRQLKADLPDMAITFNSQNTLTLPEL